MKIISSLYSSLVVVVFSFALVSIASAAAGDVVITVQSELGYIIPSAGVTFSCTGGSAFGTTTSSSGVVTIASSTLNSGGAYVTALCGGTNGKQLTIVATTTGYVATTTNSTDTNFVTSSSNTFTVENIKYAFRVSAMTRESDAADVMPTDNNGRPFSASGALTLSSSTYSTAATLYNSAAAAWYLAATSTTESSGGTLTATSSGYVNNSITSVTNSRTSQKSVIFTGGSSSDFNGSAFKFLLKLITKDELGNALSGVTVSHGGTASIIDSTSSHYFTTASGALAASLDGYAPLDGTDTGLTSVTTDRTIDQTVVTLSGTTPYTSSDPVGTSVTGNGLKFALKVTVIDSNSVAVSGATVTAGNAYGISCSESGSTGIYYCVIPISDNGTVLKVVKANYTTQTANYANRTSPSNVQTAVSITLTSGSGSGSTSSGGGGGGYSWWAPQTPQTPIRLASVTPNSSTGGNAVFTKRLVQGMTSNDVTRLQTFLGSDPSVYPEGMITGYFGPLTRRAVGKFQVKYDVAGPNDEGFGTVGPLTRAMLQEIFGK